MGEGWREEEVERGREELRIKREGEPRGGGLALLFLVAAVRLVMPVCGGEAIAVDGLEGRRAHGQNQATGGGGRMGEAEETRKERRR